MIINNFHKNNPFIFSYKLHKLWKQWRTYDTTN